MILIDRIISVTALTATLLFVGCALQLDAPGGSSTSGNARVGGLLFDENGGPAIGAQASLIPVDFNPRRDPSLPASHTAITDSIGAYRFNIADSGDFNIQAVAVSGRTVLVKGIHAAGAAISTLTDTLRNPGVIKIAMPENFDPSSGYVYIPGTIISADARGAQNNFLILSGVPADSITDVFFAATLSSSPRVLQQNIVITPGDTELVVNPGWRHVRKLFLNTTIRGAGVSINVINFPVFIRLGMSWGAFNFSEADGHGADIRFSKSDGAPLFHEIEAWDSLKNYAEIWVNVDTVFGNNDTQYVVMHWGNPGAVSASNGTKVFDTARGFQGVWHLETIQSDTVYDATFNHYHGVSFPVGANPSNPSNIGIGRSFDGTACFVVPQTESSMLTVPLNGNYSIFAWIYVQKQDTTFRVIAGKGSKQYSLSIRNEASQPKWSMVACIDSVAPTWKSAADSNPVKYNQWIMLAGVCRGGEVNLYVNGVQVSAPTVSMQDFASVPPNADGNFAIGGFVSSSQNGAEGGGYFNGIIDEVQFHNVAKGADWIRLYYENQQVADSLVVFGVQ
jgi:hypothetical protein